MYVHRDRRCLTNQFYQIRRIAWPNVLEMGIAIVSQDFAIAAQDFQEKLVKFATVLKILQV